MGGYYRYIWANNHFFSPYVVVGYEIWWLSIRPTPLGIPPVDEEDGMQVSWKQSSNGDDDYVEMSSEEPPLDMPLASKTIVPRIALLAEDITLVPSGIYLFKFQLILILYFLYCFINISCTNINFIIFCKGYNIQDIQLRGGDFHPLAIQN